MSKTFTVSLNDGEFDALVKLMAKTGGSRNGTIRLALSCLLNQEVSSSGAGVSFGARHSAADTPPHLPAAPVPEPKVEKVVDNDCRHPKEARQIRPYGSWCGICKTRLA